MDGGTGGGTESSGEVHRALAAPARRALLAELTAAGEPLEARQLAGAVGLHLTTVRQHLTALVRAGLVAVHTEPAAGRGRPRLRYAAAREREQLDAYRELVDILALGYGRLTPAQAGREWGAGTPPPDAPLADRVTAAAERWGFEPELDGRQVLLHGCPFGPNATRHPEVVCAVHQGLLDALAPGITLRPFSAPGLCTIELPGAR